MIDIKKNVPIPDRKSRSELVATMKKMAIDDLIVLEDISNTAIIYSSAKSAGVKITLRRMDGSELSELDPPLPPVDGPVVCVWRVKK